jgi:hypothetical protein
VDLQSDAESNSDRYREASARCGEKIALESVVPFVAVRRSICFIVLVSMSVM